MVDPYYRTIHGFCTLLWKEWVQYAYKKPPNPLMASLTHFSFPFAKQFPIFFHFLHLTWALLQQHCQEFQFNEKFLTVIAEAVFSCEYDSLIFDVCSSQTLSFISFRPLKIALVLKETEYPYSCISFVLRTRPYSLIHFFVQLMISSSGTP